MSHPKRKRPELKGEASAGLGVSTNIPLNTISPQGHTNFIGGNYHYAHLLVEAGKLGCTNVLGMDFNPTDMKAYFGYQSLPGIMAINIVPTIGRSNDINSGVNLAAKDIFTTIRRNNMGTLPYDPADVMLYMLGIDSALYLLSYMRRALRIASNYSWRNRFTSDAMLEVMGIDAKDLRDYMGNYVARLDLLITKARKLIYLRDFPLLADHAMLFSEIFADGEDSRSQYYVTRPSGYYVMTLLPDAPKRILQWVELDYGEAVHFSEWIDTVESIINNIAYVNTYSSIAGHIEKAFGPNAATLPLTGDLSPLEPVYNSDFGWVLQNAKPWRIERESMAVYESLDNDANLGAVMFLPVSESTGGLMPAIPNYNQTLYTSHDTLSAEDVFQATRWMSSRFDLVNPSSTVDLVLGTEHVDSIYIYYYGHDDDDVVQLSVYEPGPFWEIEYNLDTPQTIKKSATDTITGMAQICNFKWYPIMPLVRNDQKLSPMIQYMGIVGNINNYQKLDGNQIKLLHDIRQLEAFYITSVSTIT